MVLLKADLTGTVRVMGILNVTPDSYYDGGLYASNETMLARARAIVEEGGDIIDIGGESTGPGSRDVSEEEEIQRVVPVIELIKKNLPDAFISVDTYKAEVARRAIDAGASMINDVTAGRGDEEMFSVIAQTGVPYCIMFSKDHTARTTKKETQYKNVVKTIVSFLKDRIKAATKVGIDPKHIILDPGLGHFVSSDPSYSWQVLKHLESFAALAPVLVSPSRKSFLAGPQNLPPSERLEGTLIATAIALEHDARIIRTHDVGETKKVIDLLDYAAPKTLRTN